MVLIVTAFNIGRFSSYHFVFYHFVFIYLFIYSFFETGLTPSKAGLTISLQPRMTLRSCCIYLHVSSIWIKETHLTNNLLEMFKTNIFKNYLGLCNLIVMISVLFVLGSPCVQLLKDDVLGYMISKHLKVCSNLLTELIVSYNLRGCHVTNHLTS